MTDKVILFSTCPSVEEANRMAVAVVEARLAACVQILPGVQSVYHWQGKVEQSAETLLLMKTRRDRVGALRDMLSRMHSYEVPEVLAVPVVDGLPAYLDWMDRELPALEES